MSKAPYFKLYFSDLAGDTLHLSDAEIGSYVLLLGAMWNAGGYLPDAADKLARIARVTPAKWVSRWAALAPFFEVDADGVSHKRLSSERKKAFGISADRSEIGKAGAEAKRLKTLEAAQANASETEQQTASIPEAIAIEREDSLLSHSAGKPSGEAAKSGKTIKGAIPDGFPAPTNLADAETWAAGRALDLETQARRFRNHAIAEGRRCADWPAAWRTWIDFALERAGPAPAPAAPPPAFTWDGPADLWSDVVAARGAAWAQTWLGQCTFADGVLTTSSATVATRLRRELVGLLQRHKVRVVHAQAVSA